MIIADSAIQKELIKVMAIPELQLETWSRQGAVATASATNSAIHNALHAENSPIRNMDFEVYLQGSYKNTTNIRGDSDVDIVAQLESSFQYDLAGLLEDEKRLFGQSYPTNATYLWRNFRDDTIRALRAYFGAQTVTEGNKSIKVLGGSGRLPADVIACLQYRKYLRFRSLQNQSYIVGIVFYTIPEGRRIINFPKPHYDNGVDKHSQQRTNGWYKPTVRVFKNARTYLIDHNSMSEDLAPSYFLECLIYNVPDNQFGGSYQDTFCNAVNWLRRTNLNGFMCQNGQTLLFGSAQEQWSTERVGQFLNAMANLWNNWR